jgi:hypothetical protein
MSIGLLADWAGDIAGLHTGRVGLLEEGLRRAFLIRLFVLSGSKTGWSSLPPAPARLCDDAWMTAHPEVILKS